MSIQINLLNFEFIIKTHDSLFPIILLDFFSIILIYHKINEILNLLLFIVLYLKFCPQYIFYIHKILRS